MKFVVLICLIFSAVGARATILPEDFEVLQRYYGILEIRDENKFRTVNTFVPYRQRVMDLRKFAAEIEVEVGDKNEFEFEVEFEHGGTGTAMEFDQLEEFGEFESEIERGGEVALEEFYYKRRLTSSTNLFVGKAPLFMSLTSVIRHPLEHVNAEPSRLEAHMIPVEWAETGVHFEQFLPWRFTFRAAVVTGLNSEFYRKYNWIGGGHQRQFEDVRFDEPALTGSFEWRDVAEGHGLGIAYYTAKTTDNRRNYTALTEESKVYLWSALGQWKFRRVGVMGQVLRGRITNSDLVVKANNSLGGGAAPKTFGAIGAEAQLETVQLNYEFVDTWSAFLQYEHVNTFTEVAGTVNVDQRYDVRNTGWGFGHIWDEVCAVKFQAVKEWTHKPNLATTNFYYVQFAFDTGAF